MTSLAKSFGDGASVHSQDVSCGSHHSKEIAHREDVDELAASDVSPMFDSKTVFTTSRIHFESFGVAAPGRLRCTEMASP